MRDPKRIDKMLEIIKKIWKNNPDLRLMQLLLNCLSKRNSVILFNEVEIVYPRDHYNTEDDIVLNKLKELYKNDI